MVPSSFFPLFTSQLRLHFFSLLASPSQIHRLIRRASWKKKKCVLMRWCSLFNFRMCSAINGWRQNGSAAMRSDAVQQAGRSVKGKQKTTTKMPVNFRQRTLFIERKVSWQSREWEVRRIEVGDVVSCSNVRCIHCTPTPSSECCFRLGCPTSRRFPPFDIRDTFGELCDLKLDEKLEKLKLKWTEWEECVKNWK